MKKYDVVILTEAQYTDPSVLTPYISDVLTEDRLIGSALQRLGLRVTRKDWADAAFDWESAAAVLFRSTWNYFEKIEEFRTRLTEFEQSGIVSVNPVAQIRHNLDKSYLQELADAGIPVPETLTITKGSTESLRSIYKNSGLEEVVLKPAVAAGSWHTYRLNNENIADYEHIFRRVIRDEDVLLQPFYHNILTKGEVSLVVIGGRFTHAVLKRAKSGDFRVQDDFGGTVHSYQPSEKEVTLARKAVAAFQPLPAYARVDMMWDNWGRQVVSEVELIEPELWFRKNNDAADLLAAEVMNRINNRVAESAGL